MTSSSAFQREPTEVRLSSPCVRKTPTAKRREIGEHRAAACRARNGIRLRAALKLPLHAALTNASCTDDNGAAIRSSYRKKAGVHAQLVSGNGDMTPWAASAAQASAQSNWLSGTAE